MHPIPALLADLVRLPSVNPMGRTDLPPGLVHEARVTDYLEAQLRGLGVPYQRQHVAPGRDNIIAHYTPPAPPFTVLWEAHQDTVPVDGMTIDPFAAEVRDGKLFGRGACDVKAGIACMLAAFARLVREKPAGSAAVVLAFTVDEEHTFLGVQHLMRSGIRADCAVVAEPTGLNVVDAHKGVVRWRVETAGRACHSSRPDDGENAIYHMARVIYEVENYAGWLSARPPHPTLGPPTLSLGRIEGGTSPNTVPDFCRIDLDRRLLPGETAAAAIADLEEWFRNEPNTAGIPYTFSAPLLACPPLNPEGSGELVRRLGRAIDTVAGSHEVVAVPYGTDASTIAQAGVPAVVFGPGDIAQAHTKDEWVELGQVERAAEVLFRFACGH
ncbi:MAG TPA: M20 family metallopeptidase [Fimbriiglobus sp.]|nr:M20 family metallopeptidase [Fimbriiglobus sp.]